MFNGLWTVEFMSRELGVRELGESWGSDLD